ncbi:phosphatidylethanolamine N-methyltransferase-like [Lineus longissimus]|uniref:phosphatidylethanolamine N-methyltransferase-like n=1 Tax=Lineus longissimus TaxID=88925 RepID=UPI002B4DFC4B
MFIYLAFLHKQEQAFQALLRTQPTWHFLSKNVTLYIGHSLTGLGVFLVAASFRSLKVPGTFLGPAFGIRGRQESSTFPFGYPRHILGAGSVLFHIGLSVVSKCQAGLLIASLLAVAHTLAILIPCRPAMDDYKKKED